MFTMHWRRSLALGISTQVIVTKLLHKYFDGFVKPLFNLCCSPNHNTARIPGCGRAESPFTIARRAEQLHLLSQESVSS